MDLIEVYKNTEDMAQDLVFAKPWQRAYLIFLRIAPLIISALLAIYSALSSSIFSGMPFVAGTAFSILLYSVEIFIALVVVTFFFNLWNSWNVIVERPLLYRDQMTGKTSIIHKFSHARNSVWKAIRLTLKQIADTMFVILLPAGAVDLIIGIAYNDLGIGINGTGYVIEGALLTVISVLFLVYYAYTEYKRVKRLSERKVRQIEAIISRHLSNFEKGRLDMNEYIIDLGDDEL